MTETKNIQPIEPVVTPSNLNMTAPILLASMMLMIIAMVASVASGFS